ncbi:restriction endonuclease [Flavihumibacter sp. RY-1]|uniref:Restriction endonuclease n=1 Tax=Flavihumibacter fluminis TaxID=2909236 RepID=A0ABS9BI39_9BACT|nr:restriction endonuclease [Flavihumibacter fluminis]MCF1715378.1 restriction endonuclease [Flavihumibacter fluminis]
MIPDYQKLMLPVLKSCANEEVSTSAVIDSLAILLKLTEEERDELLPSGKQTTFANRVNWAKGYLKQAGLLKYTKRGSFIITEEGQKVLAKNPERIDNKFLEQFEAFQVFRRRKSPMLGNEGIEKNTDIIQNQSTPDELLRSSHAAINDALASELLSRIRNAKPILFEYLVVELLLAMGYGGASEVPGKLLGKSGDDGVDGVIDQDALGVDQIYVQAKRYAEGNNVGASSIRDFCGALDMKKTQKGIFFTTSAFSSSAEETAKAMGKKIVLIDGQKLARLMIRYNIGCEDEEVLHLKKIDEDFFETYSS